MLGVGDIAPEFELRDQAGDVVSLGGLLSAGRALVYFYPADHTPICTRQACAIRDRWPDLAGVGVRVVGISPQGESSKRDFAAANRIPFPMLADEGLAVARAYGVRGLFGLPLPWGVRRASFLVGADRRIIDRAAGELLAPHAALLGRALRDAAPRPATTSA